MTDPIHHGEPGVEYDPPTRPGALTVSQIPSVALIEVSPELEELFYAEVIATDYWNAKALEIRQVTLPLTALYREMRSIDYRASDEAKAAYEEAKQAVREERTRLIGPSGVKHVLNAEKAQAAADMAEVRDERLALQAQVRRDLFAARIGKPRWRR